MKMTDIVITLLGSGLLATLISCLVPALFFTRQRKFEYGLEYHKKLLDKRIVAYEKIERLAYFFSTSVHDNKDTRLFHIIFSEYENQGQIEYPILISELSKCNIWISDKMRDSLIEFNRFIITKNIIFTNVEHGKKYYNELNAISEKIINIARIDIDNLSDLKFLSKHGRRTHK